MYDDVPIAIMPGIYKEIDGNTAKGRWTDGSNVRFWKSMPERIGGWTLVADSQVPAPPRGAHAWLALDDAQYVAFGSAEGLHILQSTTLTDITPVGTNGFVTLIVTVSGESGGPFVAGETVTTTGGGSYVITDYVSATVHWACSDTGTISGTATGGTSGATATISGTAAAQFVDGSTSAAWNEGAWGDGAWGGVVTILSPTQHPTLWTLGNWGEDLIACPRGGKIYLWDASVGVGTEAGLMSANAPENALGIFISDVNRTVVAYGAHDGSADDPLNIAWSDEEDYTTWTPAASNSAGSIRCEVGSEIIGAVGARGGHMISTDTAIYYFRFVGQPFVFSLQKVAVGPAMIGPHAGVEYLGSAYFMGSDGIYVYDGTVRRVPCDVWEYVKGRINSAQRFKTYAGTNSEFNEVWWFYCSTDSEDEEIDSYVAYNVPENTWHIGDLARTSWIDTNSVANYPIATDADGYIYVQEYGTLGNGSAISYSLESSDLELAANGNAFAHARKLIPVYDRISGTHTVTIVTRGYPQRSEETKGPYDVTSSTDNLSVRARGRQMRLRFEGSSDFRLGVWRERVTPHGRRP